MQDDVSKLPRYFRELAQYDPAALSLHRTERLLCSCSLFASRENGKSLAPATREGRLSQEEKP